MQIRWTPEAYSNLEDILLYIAESNPDAAQKTAERVYLSIEELVLFPNRGRQGREAGTRELVLSPLPYIAAYRIMETTIEILRISHGAQLRKR